MAKQPVKNSPAVVEPVKSVFDMVAQGPKASAPLVQTQLPLSPYVQFMHPMSKNFRQMLTAVGNQPNGTPVLVNSNTFTLLSPFKFMVTEAFHQYNAESDDKGELIAYREIDTPGRNPRGWSEFIDSIIVLIIGNDLIPARCRFKGPKCPAIKTAIDALQNDAETEDFGGRSKDHGKVVASKCPKWAYHTITAAIRNVPAKSVGGFPYDLCEGTAGLSSLTSLATLTKLSKDAAFGQVFSEVIEDYNREYEKILKLPNA